MAARARTPASAGAEGCGAPGRPADLSRHGREVLGVICRCWPLLLGNIVEWYEFSVYGYLAPQMRANFFEGSSVSTWLVFAITFVSRPLGGVVLGWISDRYGRRLSVNLSVVGMLCATAGQGLLPSFRSSGQVFGTIGCALLLVLRFGQGISAGGEIGAILAYLGEVAPKKSLGSTMMLLPMTSSAAFFLANGVVALTASLLGEEHMLDWGWRLPFIFSLVPGSVAVWGRRRFPESDAFLEDVRHRVGARVGRPLSATPPSADELSSGAAVSPEEGGLSEGRRGLADLVGVFRSHGLALLISTGSVAGGASFVYVANLWCLSYLQSNGLPSTDALNIGLVSKVLGLVLMPLVGVATDVYGVGLLMLLGGAAMAATGLPVFVILASYPQGTAAMLGIGVIYTVAHILATPMLFCAELFPTSVRTLCLGISWNIGVCLFGGFGSVLAQLLLQLSPYGPGFLMSVAGCITMVSILAGLSLQRQGRLRLTHLREAPYFGRSEVVGRPAPGHAASSENFDEEPVPGHEHTWITMPAHKANGYNMITSTTSVSGETASAFSPLPHLIGRQCSGNLEAKEEDIAAYRG